MTKSIVVSSIMAICLLVSINARSHCQVPCGIYGDQARLDSIAEHITTIEKAMKQINTLSKAKTLNHNQIVRWVNTKEDHADQIQSIVTKYFMTQRIKPADKKNAKAYAKYIKQITSLHQLLIYAMKAKQTTDLANVEKLKGYLADFKKVY